VKFAIDFIEKLPGAFEDMVTKKTALQNSLNRLMSTGSNDGYVTRMWSTCSSMLTIDGFKEKDEDRVKYIIKDSTEPLPKRSVFKCIQKSTEKELRVIVQDYKGVNKDSPFGDLYAHFLIEGHTHTTHYVSMSQKFPDLKVDNTNITGVSSKCKKSVSNTDTMVLLAVDSTENTQEGRELLQKVVKRLLIDGIDKVVLLANPDAATTLPIEEVEQRVEEVF
jgi:hypothetical protein